MGWTKKERQSPEEDLRSGRPLALEHYPVDSIGKKRETCNSGDKSRPGMIKEGQQALWRDRPGSQTYLKGTQFENSEVYDGIKECLTQELVYLPWSEWGIELNRPIRYQLGKELQQVVRGKQSTAKALSNVDKKVEDILRKDN